MKISVLSFVALLSLSAYSQTAQVIQIDHATADEAKALYAQRNEIDKKIEELRKRVELEYVPQNFGGSCSGVKGSTQINGTTIPLCDNYKWMNGWEFSTDFRFIVPKIQHWPNDEQETCKLDNPNCWQSSSLTWTEVPVLSTSMDHVSTEDHCYWPSSENMPTLIVQPTPKESYCACTWGKDGVHDCHLVPRY